MPDAPPVPVPNGTGEDAYLYLESQGLTARRPAVRSSDVGLAIDSPFVYYLARRLGVVKALRWSKALNRGTWAHHAFGALCRNSTIDTYEKLLFARMVELQETMSLVGPSSPDAQRAILEREERDCRCAWAWLNIGLSIPLKSAHFSGSFRDIYLNPENYEILGLEQLFQTELFIRTRQTKSSRGDRVPVVTQPDLLLFNRSTHALLIVDLKTHTGSVEDRLASCPFEPQTQLYLESLNSLLDEGIIHQRWPHLPKDLRVAGMLHLVLQRPSIDFGSLDRHYTLDSTPFKSGPRKGQPRNERVYDGEPDFALYLERCRDWYCGTGLYADKADDRLRDPPVGVSFTSWDIAQTEWWQADLQHRLYTVQLLRKRDPHPHNFPRPTSLLSSYGELNAYAPFLQTDPSHWPEVMEREGFIISHRDETSSDDHFTHDILPEHPLP